MNTQSPIRPDIPLPSVQPQWHKMLRRCCPTDRRLALQLCRSGVVQRSGGRYNGLGNLPDADIAAALQLSLSQTTRLRAAHTPLWHWEGVDLVLFFCGQPTEEGLPTPRTLGHRIARRERRQRDFRYREERRQHLRGTYPTADDDGDLLAAED